MTKRILITGASGLIGKRLTEMLLQKGHSVSHLGRSKKSGSVSSFTWDVAKGEIDPKALTGIDAIVHLAGASVAEKRWTAKRKKEILESRIQSSALLFKALQENEHQVKTLVSASAIGYYGFESDEVFTEGSKPGPDFLAQVTRQWEEEVDKIKTLSIRVVKLRIGIVLSGVGGALAEMAKPVRLGVGSALGTGRQYLTWVHMDDLCGMFIKATEDENINGAYNAVSPQWVSNKEMTLAIAKTLNKKILLPPVPGFVLRIILGEMADMVVNGSKISSEKILRAGYQYKFTKLEEALKNLLTQ